MALFVLEQQQKRGIPWRPQASRTYIHCLGMLKRWEEGLDYAKTLIVKPELTGPEVVKIVDATMKMLYSNYKVGRLMLLLVKCVIVLSNPCLFT